MDRVEHYLAAAERKNTRRSYAAAVRHFEVEWRGLLPTTKDEICRYLADHANSLAINTLRQRLAALSRWHVDHGFVDPTKAPRVRQVFKGIRALHAVAEKRARPLEIEVVQRIDQWLDQRIDEAKTLQDQGALLRHTRNRSLLLLGFQQLDPCGMSCLKGFHCALVLGNSTFKLRFTQLRGVLQICPRGVQSAL